MVPFLNPDSEDGQFAPVPLGSNVEYIDTPAANASKIWIVATQSINDTGPVFLECQLWNVSHTYNISFLNDQQTTTLKDTQYLNTVYPLTGQGFDDDPDTGNSTAAGFGADGARFIYTMFFLSLAEQIAGTMYTVLKGEDDAQIQEGGIATTILTGSNEYYSAYKNGFTLGDHTQAIELANLQPTNQSLASMITSLAQNVTTNMLTDSFFTYVHSTP